MAELVDAAVLGTVVIDVEVQVLLPTLTYKRTMLTARCKLCNKELTSTSKVQFCGCPNQMRIIDDTISAIELNHVILTKSKDIIKNHGILTDHDLKYQEDRRKRKVRKLTYEER